MLYLILTLCAGIVAGWLSRRCKFVSFTGKAISVTICVMLFVMGVEIGADENVLRNLSGVGLQSLLLAFAGVAGSSVFVAVLYRIVFQGRHESGKAQKN